MPGAQAVQEIEAAAREAAEAGPRFRVPIVPVRMTEAWLLLETDAIRRAADNPNGDIPLAMPRLRDIETQPDPKHLLDDLLIAASEKNGRRRDMFRRELAWRRARVATLIQDYSPLRQVPAFASFASETRRVVELWANAQS